MFARRFCHILRPDGQQENGKRQMELPRNDWLYVTRYRDIKDQNEVLLPAGNHGYHAEELTPIIRMCYITK